MKKIVKKIIKIFIAFLVASLAVMIILFYFYPSLFTDFYISNGGESIWVKTRPVYFSWKVIDTSSEYKDLSWSPDEKHLVYTDFVREILYDKEYFIKVIDPRILKVRTVFIGTDHMSHYRWLNNNTIRVYASVGTGMRIYRDIDIHLKEPFVAIENQGTIYWTPQAWWEYDD